MKFFTNTRSIYLLIVLTVLAGLQACGGGGSSPGAANTPPVATAQSSVATLKNTAVDITLAGTDADGDSLSFTVATNPSNGALTGTAPNLTYTPTTDFVGSDSFTFTVNDGTDSSSPATINITVSAPVTTFELFDPTPRADDQFGFKTVILATGNIIVSDPFDSSVFSFNGAIHLFDPVTRTVIASIYGTIANEVLGYTDIFEHNITALTNGNFVLTSPESDAGGATATGSVRLFNGNTGLQIGSTLAGNDVNDRLGRSAITELTNGNYVIASSDDDSATVVNAGSVILVDGTTGVQIGATLEGDVAEDQLGIDGSVALTNGNYVIGSRFDDEGMVVNSGSVRLVNGATGVQIGATLAGNDAADQFGNKIIALPNGHYVAVAQQDDVGVQDAGSVRLMNGTTAAPIGTIFEGTTILEGMGNRRAVLPNGNFVIGAPGNDDVATNSGVVMLVSGTTGLQIGTSIKGDALDDLLGITGIIALANSNYVIGTWSDTVGAVTNAGSVILVNGTTGAEIATLTGDVAEDKLGVNGVAALASSNFVIASGNDDVGAVTNAGSVILVDGVTGVQIGATLAGDVADDMLGRDGITVLTNDNFVVASADDDVNGVVDAGSILLVDGSTGLQIGSTLAGDTDFDNLGDDTRGVTALANNNFVVVSKFDDENGVVDAGSARLVDGASGVQLKVTTGSVAGLDLTAATITGSAAGDYYILAAPFADNNGSTNSGLVLQINE